MTCLYLWQVLGNRNVLFTATHSQKIVFPGIVVVILLESVSTSRAFDSENSPFIDSAGIEYLCVLGLELDSES